MAFSFASLNDPAYFAENRLPTHSNHRWYPDAASAAEGRNPNCFFLNGAWSFAYAENEAGVPAGFEAADYDVSGWDTIQVPGHIQLQGYDIPQYVNKQYPWDGMQEVALGEVPVEFNPVACYVRSFRLPETVPNGRTFLSLQGVESCCAVWLNGSYVGYSANSFSPCEFELTPYLRAGENRLALRVYKWNCGSWFEDQDFYRFSGIYRDVYIYVVPELHLQDLKLLAEPDAALVGGSISLEGTLLTAVPCTAELYVEGKHLCTATVSGTTLTARAELPAVELWSAESPRLYTLELQLFDKDGTPCEVVRQPFGFRRFELKDGLMQLNGRRIVFKGVNRHDFAAEVGRAVTPELIRRDLLTMKRNNINAVRCCHYPNHPALYELCDELGLYVIAENNMETHGTWDCSDDPIATCLPGDRVCWKPMLLDRIHALYENLKNHTSILIWSVGNESFGGSVIADMAEELRRLDQSRLVHYEGVFHDRRYSAESSDMESQMYSTVADIKAYLAEHRDRPMISCEYGHGMGNSCGGLDRYTGLAEEDPLYQGGFIWDYLDQAIVGEDRDGNPAYFYGGDLGDRPHDGNFSGNGICFCDGTPAPKMVEVKADYQDFAFTISEEQISIRNRALFTDSAQYVCRVTLEREGKPVAEATLITAVPPLEERTYDNPIPIPIEPGEYALTVSMQLREACAWAEAGYEIAFGQYVFRREGSEARPTAQHSPLKVIETDFNIGVQGEGFHVLFSKFNGGLVSYRVGGREFLKAPPRPNFWRPLIDNDLGGSIQLRLAQWKSASAFVCHRIAGKGFWNKEFDPTLSRGEDGSVTVEFTYRMPTQPASSCYLSYRVLPEGTIACTLTALPEQLRGLPPMPEFGVLFRMASAYHNLTWYGEGPEECYVDRRNGVRLGVWEGDVLTQLAPYLRPQESGNHTGVRWARVTDDAGCGLEFSGDGMEFSALPWTPDEIDCAEHPFELPPVYSTVVRCSLMQMGVGGDDTWGTVPHPEYWLPDPETLEEPLRFTVRIRGFVTE